MNLPTIAAKIPPRIGATMNTHSWESASPPTNKAGAILRAGLTDVPVNGIPNKWIKTNVKPITSPAKEELPFYLLQQR